MLSRVEKEGSICGVTAKVIGFLCNMYLLHKPHVTGVLSVLRVEERESIPFTRLTAYGALSTSIQGVEGTLRRNTQALYDCCVHSMLEGDISGGRQHLESTLCPEVSQLSKFGGVGLMTAADVVL